MPSRFPTRRVPNWERARPVEKQKQDEADAHESFADRMVELLDLEEPDDDRE